MPKKIPILTALILLWAYQPAWAQEGESKTVRFHINNLPKEEIEEEKDTQPPAIRILTPSIQHGSTYVTDKEEINLVGEVTDESTIKFVTVNSDIRSVNESGVFSATLFLYPGENSVRLVAMDEMMNLGDTSFKIEYRPPVVTLADKINEKSKYYALIIGIDKYEDPNLPDLENPISDAADLFETLTENYTFHPDNIRFLKNARRSEIIYELDMMAREVTPNDNVLIFYAGHGTWDQKANIGYWLPADAYLSTTANWFRNSTLVDYLKVIDSKHTLLITDACFAGSIFKTRSVFPEQEKAYEILYELPSRKAMTSGTLTEVPDRSSFTRYLIQRLQDNESMYLSSEELFSSFRIAVINNSDAIPQYGEIRYVGDEGGDFIFLKKE